MRFLAISLLTLAWSPCWAENPPDSLRVAINSDIRSTNPGVLRDSNTDTVLHHVVESLVAYDDNARVVPLLSSNYSITDDGKTYSFDLRKGVLFHNGQEMTSEHVLWSWQRYLDPATGWRCRSWYDGSVPASARIVSMEAPSRYRVIIHLAEPSFIFLHRLAHLQCITAVLHPDSVDAAGEWVAPIGTGPYRLREWRRGEFVDLVQFDDYVSRDEPASGLAGRKQPLAHSLRFTVVPDPAITKAALQAGDIDVAVSLPISHHEELIADPGLQIVVQPTFGWMTLLLQPNDPLLSNALIRRAIAHAIDSNALADFATRGFGVANSAAIPNSSPYYTDAYRQWYEHDPEKSRQLLIRAGYSDQVLRIQTNRKHLHLYENAIILHAMLREAGFNVELDVLDWASHLNNFYTGNFQLSAFDFSTRTEPFMNYSLVTRKRGTQSTWGWDNKRAHSLLKELDDIFEPARRQQLFLEMHALMREDVPIIGLYNLHDMIVLGRGVCGFTGWRLQKPRFWGVSDQCIDGKPL